MADAVVLYPPLLGLLRFCRMRVGRWTGETKLGRRRGMRAADGELKTTQTGREIKAVMAADERMREL